MLTEKKYLTPDYICQFCIGLLRYDPLEAKTNNTLLPVGKFVHFFFVNKVNPYNLLSKVYETDNLVYLTIFAELIALKIANPNTKPADIKQELINKIEGKVDNNSFTKAHKFIAYICSHVEDPRFNSTKIADEYLKALKYILLDNSLNSLYELHEKFYAHEDASEKYDSVLADVFTNYEEGIVNDDFIIGHDDESVSDALEESAVTQEEVRGISFLEDIRFLEKNRIAILIGASGAGKSMFLCHCAGEYLRNEKKNNKTNIVFYFTFENSKAETFLRIVANMTDIKIDQLKEDIKDPVKKKNIIKRYLQKKDDDTILVICELPPKRHNMTAIEAVIDKTLLSYTDAEVYGIILDYADKMLPVGSSKNLRTDEALGLIVDDFKAVTKLYNTCGITVSQFNREGAKKAHSDDEMASATDIGGGWSKYENADVVLTMQVKNTFEDLGHNLVLLVNEKHRYYRDGTVIDAIYKPEYAKFMLADASQSGTMAGNFANPIDTTDSDTIKSVSLF